MVPVFITDEHRLTLIFKKTAIICKNLCLSVIEGFFGLIGDTM